MLLNRIFLGILFCILVNSCAPGPLLVSNEDVSEDSELWCGYLKEGRYLLIEDVFIRIIDLPLPNKHILVAPREKTKGIYTLQFSSPNTIDEYENNREQWNSVKGIVRKNTRLKCTRLIRYDPFLYPDTLYIYASIIDGPFNGLEVEISELSILGPETSSGYLLRPNPKLIVPIE